jgi:hypothetical protein
MSNTARHLEHVYFPAVVFVTSQASLLMFIVDSVLIDTYVTNVKDGIKARTGRKP